MKKNLGFTLAEVLITLGIIGVVSALTIPNLITEHQKRSNVTKLKRAISVINQAYKLSFDEVGNPEGNIGALEYFKTYWEPYVKVLTYCSDASICGYTSNEPFFGPSKAPAINKFVNGDTRVSFLTSDGFMYMIFTGIGVDDYIANSGMIMVDINGSEKPNRFGNDVFSLVRLPEGENVVPLGYDMSDEEVRAKCSPEKKQELEAGSSSTCAERIRRAGWQMDKDYPFK